MVAGLTLIGASEAYGYWTGSFASYFIVFPAVMVIVALVFLDTRRRSATGFFSDFRRRQRIFELISRGVVLLWSVFMVAAVVGISHLLSYVLPAPSSLLYFSVLSVAFLLVILLTAPLAILAWLTLLLAQDMMVVRWNFAEGGSDQAESGAG